MFGVRRFAALAVLIGAMMTLAGCQDDTLTSQEFQWQPLYGDFTKDTSPIAASVGDIEITERMVKLYIDELPERMKANFQGPDGERLALKKMVDQVLMVRGAMDLKIYNDQDVARQLISQRRNTLDYAMRNYGLLRDNKPTEEDLRQFFDDNRENYRRQGLVNARHVECMSKDDAELAYKRLMSGGYKDRFASVVHEMSVNEETRENGGATGWFSKGGIIPFIRQSPSFAEQAFDLEIGLHPPFRAGDRWHVVEIVARDHPRPQTFNEARNKLEMDMLPGWQDAIIKDYLRDARQKHPVKMVGKFAPGKGASAAELLARALAIPDNQKKLDVLNLLYTDYPNSDRADDALFMSANVALETWDDKRIAARYLDQLLDEYPDSELAEDAKFLRDNLYNPKVLNPQSIEDLKQN